MRLINREHPRERQVDRSPVAADAVERPDAATLDRADRAPEATREARAPGRPNRRERTWAFAPGQVVSFAVGVAAVAVGVLALVRAGVDGSLDTPTVGVLGYSHTAWLGVAEIAVGAVLMLAGTGPRGRPLSILIGAAAVVTGVVIIAEPDRTPTQLGLEKNFGWPMIAAGALVALAAIALPVWRSREARDDDLIDADGDRRANRLSAAR
jgi:hypothetical protein